MKKTVLLVNNSKLEEKALKAAISSEYHIEQKANCQKALDFIHKQYLIISAIVLYSTPSESDSFEFLNTLRSNDEYSSIPVIVLSGENSEEVKKKAIMCGANGFLTEPVDSELLIFTLQNSIKLSETASSVNAVKKDELTGLPNRDTFFSVATELIENADPGFYTIAYINIDSFKVVNDQYGTSVGDSVLKHIAEILRDFAQKVSGIGGRITSDQFAVLYPQSYEDSELTAATLSAASQPPCLCHQLKLRVGRYHIDDISVPISSMLDRATIAADSIQGRFDVTTCTYTDDMRKHIVREQEIVSKMYEALNTEQFEVWFQPQINHATKALIGAEALVRWRASDGKLVSPGEFIPIFEKNGFVYEVDKYVWERVCKKLREWLDNGFNPVPVSVNISRYDIFCPDLSGVLSGLVKKYDLPIDLLRLEITESAFADSGTTIVNVIKDLVALGFTVEIDDFGSGYSSLNTLKDVPANVLKLDMRFFENSADSQRSGNIVESVARMAKWLGMSVIAEGVEEKEQADYLESIGCNYIQGYFYSRPLPLTDYEEFAKECRKNHKFNELETIANFDNSSFWDAKSLDTMVFNHFSGGACIFEYNNDKFEMLRVNNEFAKTIGSNLSSEELLKQNLSDVINDEAYKKIKEVVKKAYKTGQSESCEVYITLMSNPDKHKYIRLTIKRIAGVDKIYLFYCYLDDITKQRKAEHDKQENMEKLRAVMDNINGGVAAVKFNENGSVDYSFTNDRFFEMFGYTQGEMEKSNIHAMSLILPEDFEAAKPLVREHVFGDRKPFAVDFRCRKKDGTIIYIHCNMSFADIAGIGDGVMISFMNDITEQKILARKEQIISERIKAIMDNATCGIASGIMENGKLTQTLFVNDKFYDLVGYTEEEYHLSGNFGFSLMHPDDYKKLHTRIERLDTIGMSDSYEVRVKHRNGNWIWLKCDVAVVKLREISKPVLLACFSDITERVLSQQRERAASSQLSVIMAKANGGISAMVYHSESDIDIIFTNDAFYGMHGYTKEQWDSEVKNAADLILPEDRAATLEKLERIVSEHGSETYEYRCKKRDGSIMWISSSNSVISLPGWGNNVILSVTTDTTELHSAREKEKDANEKLRAIINNISSAISVSIVEGENINRVFTNSRYWKLVGYTEKEYFAKFKNGMGPIHPDDRDKTIELFKSSMEKREPMKLDYRIIRGDGKVSWIRHRIVTTTIPGFGENVQLSILDDVTAQKRAEEKEIQSAEKFRAVIESVINGVTATVLGDKPKMLFANDRYFELFGLTRTQYELNTFTDFFALVNEDDRDKVKKAALSVSESGKPTTLDYRIHRPTGETVWLRTTISIIKLSGIDNPVQVGVFTDVTEEKKSEMQIQFVNDLASEILSQPYNDKAIDGALSRIREYFDADRAYIIEIDRDQKLADNTYEICSDGVIPQIENLQGVKYTESDLWVAPLERNEVVIIENVDALKDENLRNLLKMQDIKSLVFVPLMRSNKAIGFAGVDNPRRAVDQIEKLRAPADFLSTLIYRRDIIVKMNDDAKDALLVMNGIPGGFIRFKVLPDNSLKEVFYSDGYLRLTDMTREELDEIHKNGSMDMLHPDDVPFVTDSIMRLLSGENVHNAIYRLRHGKNGYIWAAAYAKMRVSNTGERFLNVFYSDATEQVEKEALQTELLDNLPCGAALYEFDGKELKVKHLNRHYWELVERAHQEYEDISFINAVHPDDRAIIAPELSSAIRHNRDFNADLRILCGDDKYKAFHVTGKIEKQDNGNYLIYATYMLITDEAISFQKMMPIALSALMSSYDDATYVKDIDGRYICASRPVMNILGIKNVNEVIGKTNYEFLERKLADSFCEREKKVISTGEACTGIIETLKDKNGKAIVFITSLYPLLDSDGNVIGIYGVSRDVTDQREKEAQRELMLRTIPGGIASYSINKNGVECIFFNDGYYDYTGYTRDEYVKITAKEPLALIHNEDRDGIRAMLKEIIIIGDGAENTSTYRCLTKSGKCRWMKLTCRLTRINDEQAILNVVQIDVTDSVEYEEKLKQHEQEYRLAIMHSGRTICRYDIVNHTLAITSEAANRLKLPQVIQNFPECVLEKCEVSGESEQAYKEFYKNIISGEKESTAVFFKKLNYGWRWIEATASMIFDKNGKAVSAIISYLDITEQLDKEAIYRKWNQALQDRDERNYTLFVRNLNKGTSSDKMEGTLLEFAPIGSKNMTFNDRVLLFAQQCVVEEDREMYIEFLDSEALLDNFNRGNRSMTTDYRLLHKDGTIHWINLSVELVEYPNSTDVMAYIMNEDVTAKKTAELEKTKMAETDPLTGILNRKTFLKCVNEAIRNSAPGTQHAFYMMDIDGFKIFNDTFGHGTGDDLLVETSRTIKSLLRSSDLVGRLGGDEFVVFLENIKTTDIIAKKAAQICKAINKNYSNDVTLSISVGGAIYPQDGKNFDELYKNADSALYVAKGNGKNTFCLFKEDMTDNSTASKIDTDSES